VRRKGATVRELNKYYFVTVNGSANNNAMQRQLKLKSVLEIQRQQK